MGYNQQVMYKVDQIEVTPEDRQRYRNYTDGSIQGIKFVESIPSERLLKAATFDSDGYFDHDNLIFIEILADFDPKTNPSWLASRIAETLYMREEIDVEKFDRLSA